MKGVVFTEFVEMVEDLYSPELADKIITDTNPASGGAYTSVGTYEFEEMVALLTALSREIDKTIPEILHMFGMRLFKQFELKFPEIFVEAPDSFSFLEKVEAIIHVEVRKLYPDAELPAFQIEREAPERLVMVYDSPRALSDFGFGLMSGCFAYFGEQVDVTKTDLSNGAGTHVKFVLERK